MNTGFFFITFGVTIEGSPFSLSKPLLASPVPIPKDGNDVKMSFFFVYNFINKKHQAELKLIIYVYMNKQLEEELCTWEL